MVIKVSQRSYVHMQRSERYEFFIAEQYANEILERESGSKKASLIDFTWRSRRLVNEQLTVSLDIRVLNLQAQIEFE